MEPTPQGTTGADGTLALRGFHGHYIQVGSAGITRTFSIQPGTRNEWTIQIPDGTAYAKK